MIKKIASIIMTAVCLLSFTACHGLPKPVSYYPDITDEKIANVFNEYHMTNMLKVGNDFDFFDERPHALYFQKVKEVKE